MKLKKLMALSLAGILVLSVTACGKNNQTDLKDGKSIEPEIVLDIAFENNISEPIGAGWEKALNQLVIIYLLIVNLDIFQLPSFHRTFP